MFELSRETAIRRGYWTGDMGDDLNTAADPLYGYDGEAPLPPITEQHGEPEIVSQEPVGIDAEREADICVNDDDELRGVQELMPDFDFGRNDENWGIDVYCEAVLLLKSRISDRFEHGKWKYLPDLMRSPCSTDNLRFNYWWS
ncbi:hypothetical protein B0H17DRAFT_1131977 [Mycena rosella]|uniref:Uncharacterized protein n=1 Tax=Mycena rosella TaxID=1033263 RepID=A0AAD7GJX7_MYCRO|nr:hypothetical protein B0H17DRAFT_1131977 [Mycena rosella]